MMQHISSVLSALSYATSKRAAKNIGCEWDFLPSVEELSKTDRFGRKHLIRDLKPYVCIFQDCQTPEKLYGSINEWTSHMTQEEQTFEWYCDSTVHQEVMIFSSQHDFEAHMRNEHESPMSNLELSRFSDRHRRPGVKLFLECPLCYFAPPEGNDYQTQDILRRHVASHLQSLSLFSLPNLPDDGFSYDQSEEPSERANGQDDNADGGSLQAPLSSFHTPPTESTVDDLIVGGDTSHAEEFELDPCE